MERIFVFLGSVSWRLSPGKMDAFMGKMVGEMGAGFSAVLILSGG